MQLPADIAFVGSVLWMLMSVAASAEITLKSVPVKDGNSSVERQQTTSAPKMRPSLTERFPRSPDLPDSGAASPDGWGNWGGWSSCSVTCAIGTRTRLRICLQEGRCLTGSGQDSRPCRFPACSVLRRSSQNQQVWGQWSACSSSCRRTRSRHCATQSCQQQAETQTEPCRDHVNCAPSAWSSWRVYQRCSVTCGVGRRVLHRQCRSSSGCPGESQRTEQCRQSPCPTASWGPWSVYRDCSVTCGAGHRVLRRQCRGGSTCSGESQRTERCQKSPCPTGSWGEWRVSRTCSVSCGVGHQVMRRRCQGAGRCFGESQRTEKCSKPPCLTASWGQWSVSQDCSVTCGVGRRVLRRRCRGGSSCSGESQRTEDCRKAACPEGKWAKWMPWTSCSASCGRGNRTRRRHCVGLGCRGDRREIESCGGRACPTMPPPERITTGQAAAVQVPSTQVGVNVAFNPDNFPALMNNGGYQSWGLWSACSTTCGTGNEVRSRDCGRHRLPCFGHTRQTRPCVLDSCEGGHWSSWSPWSNCSISCGEGNAIRTRYCRESFCLGSVRETKRCMNRPCNDDVKTTTATLTSSTDAAGAAPENNLAVETSRSAAMASLQPGRLSKGLAIASVAVSTSVAFALHNFLTLS